MLLTIDKSFHSFFFYDLLNFVVCSVGLEPKNVNFPGKFLILEANYSGMVNRYYT